MDLFELNKQRQLEKSAPLADRMRPENIEDFFGTRSPIGRRENNKKNDKIR